MQQVDPEAAGPRAELRQRVQLGLASRASRSRPPSARTAPRTRSSGTPCDSSATGSRSGQRVARSRARSSSSSASGTAIRNGSMTRARRPGRPARTRGRPRSRTPRRCPRPARRLGRGLAAGRADGTVVGHGRSITARAARVARHEWTPRPFLPERVNLTALRAAAPDCRGCDLHGPATQTVFGEGRKASRLMLVGEVPGDREDRAGHVFVGPAGRELDRALATRGSTAPTPTSPTWSSTSSSRSAAKRRIHQKPTRSEVKACLPWLSAELRVGRARGARPARRHGGPGAARRGVPAHARARPRARLEARTARDRHDPPVGDPARPRRRRAHRRARARSGADLALAAAYLEGRPRGDRPRDRASSPRWPGPARRSSRPRRGARCPPG